MMFRLQSAVTLTLILAGSWCVSQNPNNVFWLSLGWGTYGLHLGLWLGVLAALFLLLTLAGRRSDTLENKLLLFLIVISPLNILDYGMRSVFGQVGRWPKEVLFTWSAVTVAFFPLAAFLAFRYAPSRSFLKKIIQICLIPGLLFAYYALPFPSKFTTLTVEKPFRAGSKPPIHLFLFDMMSYEFLMPGGTVNPAYPHFQSFAQGSDVFHNATSPSGSTAHSIPQLLTGLKIEDIAHPNTQIILKSEGAPRERPLAQYETLFTVAQKEGYNVFYQGFCLPLLNDLADSVQQGRSHPFDNLWRLGMHSLIWPILSPGGLQHHETTETILDATLERIRDNPRQTFFYIHWTIPHDPFIYRADGTPLNRFELSKRLAIKPNRKTAYQHQLIGTDKVFGRVIKALKDSGLYEESLIIVTSDHNIKGYGFNMKHIPLIIKKPHQKKPGTFTHEVTTLHTLKFLKHYLTSGELNLTLLKKTNP